MCMDSLDARMDQSMDVGTEPSFFLEDPAFVYRRTDKGLPERDSE